MSLGNLFQVVQQFANLDFLELCLLFGNTGCLFDSSLVGNHLKGSYNITLKLKTTP